MNTLWPTPTDLTSLYDSQIQILPSVFSSRIGILAGTPGTGKSFVTAAIIKQIACNQQYGQHTIAVVAPTGKASVRITELMARNGLSIQATTIHRLLEVGRNGHDGKGWGFHRNEFNPLSQKFVFVDESSMLDTNLASSFMKAVPNGAHVLFIGDPYQLPPVGHGAPLRDMINSRSQSIGYGELTEVQRNAGDIVHGCRKIKNGEYFQPRTSGLDPSSGKNWIHFERKSESSQIDQLKRMLMSIPDQFDRIDDVQVICALNGKSEKNSSPISRLALNQTLQQLLNPANPIDGKRRFAMHDKVICTANGQLEICESYTQNGFTIIEPSGISETVANGDIGRVIAMEDKRAVVQLQYPNRKVLIPVSGGDSSGDTCGKARFELGYAVTCHKMQGSQSPVIVGMIDDSRGADYVASREWHYTAISRTEQICLTIGSWSAMMRQCAVQSLGKRKTFLQERLVA